VFIAPLIRKRFGVGVSIIVSERLQQSFLMKSDRLLGGCGMPVIVCRLAAPRSRSIKRVRKPSFARIIPREPVRKLFPEPPLPPPIGHTRDIPPPHHDAGNYFEKSNAEDSCIIIE
jgi:hypothetical protein